MHVVLSPVEQRFLDLSGKHPSYPGERIPLIETRNVSELGRLAALRFIEWVISNPYGVVSLPTGKTPEYFIKHLEHYKYFWSQPDVRRELSQYGIEQKHFPKTHRLKFVQIDEFYPIRPAQQNSFNHYIRKYYLSLLGIRPQHALLIDSSRIGLLKNHNFRHVFLRGKVDLSLRDREPLTDEEMLQKQAIAQADVFAAEYENTIRDWGGIGFFLGGIGPDGHIAFNIRGSSFDSTTRLLSLNYESAAAAATDLGGIENSRGKAVITIGLSTIVARPDAAIIIFAAGATKSHHVADAIESPPDCSRPASVLQGHPGARFYVTTSAASALISRREEMIRVMSDDQLAYQVIDQVVIDLALKLGKPLQQLTLHDFSSDPISATLWNKLSSRFTPLELGGAVATRLRHKISTANALPTGKTILHTAPHHDDIMLSYLPILDTLLSLNHNQIAYLTSGFTAVANAFIKEMLAQDHSPFLQDELAIIFDVDMPILLADFANAYQKKDRALMKRIEHLIFLGTFVDAFQVLSREDLFKKLKWLSSYLWRTYPGQKDIPPMQMFKGMLRETESNRKWSILGLPPDQVHHLRLKFYNGDLFTPRPTIHEDTQPFLTLFERVFPDYVTVAFDPEGSGPDTHYKVLQVVAQALRMSPHASHIKIWGYRNVWHRFSISEANMMLPVSASQMMDLDRMFVSCFSTQRQASFPSPYYDGPFSSMSRQIQTEQLSMVSTLLGDGVESLLPADCKGLIFLKEMALGEFLTSAQELKAGTE